MQTNIWQDPYVKSEAVLFLYELDTDAHTAAMMMCQEEEEQGMFASGDACAGFGYGGFGQAGFGNGGTASANNFEIPQSLQWSMLSSVGGTSASHSGEQGATSKSTNINSSSEEALGASSLQSPALTAEHIKSPEGAGALTQEEAAVVQDVKVTRRESKAEEALTSNADPSQCAHKSLALEDIAFLVTPNRGAPLVASRTTNGKEAQDSAGDVADPARWECQPFQVSGAAPLVCVSAMAPLQRDPAACERNVQVSILRLPDREEVCSGSLCGAHPSQIFQLQCDKIDGFTFAAAFEEMDSPAPSAA
jgi:hypothetical protein